MKTRILLGLTFWLVLNITACATQSARVLIEWTTASETNTAGFNLYRSQNADGPFAKINSEMIPATSDPVLGGKYRYEDVTVAPGATYFYKLEDLETTGVATMHDAVRVTASGGFGMNQVAWLAGGAGVAAALGWAFWRRRAIR